MPRRRGQPTRPLPTDPGFYRRPGDHEREVRIRAVFQRDPARLFSVVDLAAAAGVGVAVARAEVDRLERAGWLERGRNHRGGQAWRRPVAGRPATGYLPPVAGAARYFCKQCHLSAHDDQPPDGWWRVQQRDREAERRSGRSPFETRALLCSPACLVAWAASTREVAV